MKEEVEFFVLLFFGRLIFILLDSSVLDYVLKFSYIIIGLVFCLG